MKRLFLTLALLAAPAVTFTSCQWLSRQAEVVGAPVSTGIDKVNETVPQLVGVSQQLQAFYDLNREQINQLLPNAPELFAQLAEGTQKAASLNDELAALQAQAKAASRRPDGSTDWGAYVSALVAGLLAWEARRRGLKAAATVAADVQVAHDRVTNRKDENAAMAERLAVLEALLASKAPSA
jgi:cell division septum initiation protein DivIVA